MSRTLEGSISNEDAERCILGSIMLENAHWLAVSDRLRAGHFSLDSHRRIFQQISAMMRAGQAVDILTLSEALTAGKLIEAVGGVAYLASLTEGLIRLPNVDDYIAIVQAKAQLRSLSGIADELGVRCQDQVETPRELIAWADGEILGVGAADSAEPSNASKSGAAFEKLMRRRYGEETLFVPSGIAAIDRTYGGYASGELTVLGGRPKQGKSSAVMQAIAANCSKGNPVDFYSMEMRDEAVRFRLWSIFASVPFHKIRHPERLSDVELGYVRAAEKETAKWPLYVCDRKLAVDEVVSKVKLGKLRRGTKLTAIDYLQKMKLPGKIDQRFAAVSDASAKLADLANETGVAVLILSSLTEARGRNRNEPPTLQDLRMSGDIQYDAHSAFLIHRCINDETETLYAKGQIILAAARSDKGGALDVVYDEDFLMFA